MSQDGGWELFCNQQLQKQSFMLYILSPTPRVYQHFGVRWNTCLGGWTQGYSWNGDLYITPPKESTGCNLSGIFSNEGWSQGSQHRGDLHTRCSSTRTRAGRFNSVGDPVAAPRSPLGHKHIGWSSLQLLRAGDLQLSQPRTVLLLANDLLMSVLPLLHVKAPLQPCGQRRFRSNQLCWKLAPKGRIRFVSPRGH